ncbi:MAG: flagellar motor switch protein FliM [Candidatus Gastranaerophilales bacterium]|nr:flagellar motor switch protein FliM [Candidatus Gastranaerophilales bacterium]
MADSDILSQSEIDQLLASLTGEVKDVHAPEPGTMPHSQMNDQNAINVASTIDESAHEEDKKGYKLYNFRRPDKFSKDHLRALQDIHKEFSRQLSLVLTAYLRMHVEIDIVSVDQLTYDEFTRSMPNPITIGITELNPLSGQILIGVSHEITSSIVDRMLGGTGSSEIKSRELTDVEEALARKILDRITLSLEESWKHIFPVQGIVVGIDNNYSLIQIVTPGEIVALVTLEVQIASSFSGLLSLCFPYPVLETVLGQLSTQHIFQSKGILTSTEDKEKILSKINKTNVNVKVILGETDISLKDFMDLTEGDVLKLDNLVTDNLVMSVNDEEKFYCRPGTKKKNIAVSIVDSIKYKD